VSIIYTPDWLKTESFGPETGFDRIREEQRRRDKEKEFTVNP
jgi:hypothetical protein